MTNQDPFSHVHETLPSFQGYGLEHLHISVTGSVDALEISLSPLSPKLAISLSVRGIHYFAIQRAPREDIPFLDFTAKTLLPPMPWPPELPGKILGSDAVPLLWLHADGPATFDLVAATFIVLAQRH
ncbi:hypothetical protein ACFYO1_15115 [Nocardia sp. NPDC006044]|uniref:hypothetical protein n=1 Tax=Nocardia sp. NPDC006044 TaxID=3364306 RepID=UPI0036768CBD